MFYLPRLLVFCTTFLLVLPTMAQSKFILSGTVTDSETGETLPGAAIYIPDLQSGTVTNQDGIYRLELPQGHYRLEVKFLGYETEIVDLDLKSNKTLNISLTSDEMLLGEIEITGEAANSNVSSIEMGVNRIDAKTIKEIPAFLGEPDIVRSILLLPGVTTVGEGATGFNVRGGNIDQNLVLVDQAPIFSSSHLFGFFSVFNTDAVEDVTLYRGGIPARYGSRLSSVLDIHQRSGNMDHFSANGGVGLVFSRLTLETPIVKDKLSVIVSGRRSYVDVFFPLVSDELSDSRVFFYDLNGKLTYVINENNRLFLSAYTGDDVFQFGKDFRIRWGSKFASLRYNHIFGSKLVSDLSLIRSDYRYTLGIPEGTQAFDFRSGIQSWQLKSRFTYRPGPRHTVEFGGDGGYYSFNPGETKSLGEESFFVDNSFRKENAIQLAAFVADEFSLTDNVTLMAGLRYSHFLNIGPQLIYTYAGNDPVQNPTPLDSISYGSGEVISQYGNFEPRLALNYTLNPAMSIKVGYNRMAQYMHLVSNTTSATPFDLWTPAGKYVKPATADQISAGWFQNFKENTYEFSAEVYYKRFTDLLDYKNGAQLLLNPTLETELKSGNGRAYGLEVQVKKNGGRLNGWVSYTLSRSELKVPGINNGEYYPSNYNKLHDLSVVSNYELNERWKVSAVFSYMSGRPITYPDSRYVYQGVVIPNYSNRNGANIPDYHRLDLSATFQTNPDNGKKLLFLIKKPRGWTSSWTFSLYNVYARKNAYSIYFKQDADNPARTDAYQLTILGTVIPGISYNFSF